MRRVPYQFIFTFASNVIQARYVMPPPFAELRALPSRPADKIRQLRREGLLENDFTSNVSIRGADIFMPPVQFTREPVFAAR